MKDKPVPLLIVLMTKSNPSLMTLKKMKKILTASFQLLKDKNPLLLSSATSFFSLLSLAPIIILIVNILSLYFKQENVTEGLFNRLQAEFGPQAARQIQNIVNNFIHQASSFWLAVMGIVFLIFVATTLFNVINQALNYLWNIRIHPERPLAHTLFQRTKAMLLIFTGGILFVITLLADTAMDILGHYLHQLLPSVDTILLRVVSNAIYIVVVTCWFAIMFKFLPDAKLKWKYALIGGIFTAVLFSIGEFLLGLFLNTNNLDDIFGASASIMLLLLFIFYSSLIMYFGAAFTLIYATEAGHPIKPKKYAEQYELLRKEEQ